MTSYDEDYEEIELEKVKLNLNTGEVTINLLDVVRNLSDEEKEDLLWDNGWWAFISDHLMEVLATGYATATYNNDIHQFRKKLLSSDVAPRLITEFVEGLAREFAYNLSSSRRYEKAWWRVYHAYRQAKDYMDSERAFEAVGRSIDEDLEPYEARTPIVKGIPEFVKEFMRVNNLIFADMEETDE